MTANPALAHEPAFAPAPAADDSKVVLETRFGVMSFDRSAAIYMPRGLLGYADFHDFALANLPDPKLAQFKLLQSLSEPALSFVVAPLPFDNDLIARADIEGACRTLSIAVEDAAMLLVVATRRIGAATQISINLRAPVIVDLRNQAGWQQILSNHRYPVRHVIGMGSRAAD